MAAAEAVKEAIWLRSLFEDLGVGQKHIDVFCDSQSAIHLAKNQVFHARMKHIDVRYHFVREILEEEEIFLQKILTTENPADMLTKVVTKAKFKHCLDLVNILHIWVDVPGRHICKHCKHYLLFFIWNDLYLVGLCQGEDLLDVAKSHIGGFRWERGLWPL